MPRIAPCCVRGGPVTLVSVRSSWLLTLVSVSRLLAERLRSQGVSAAELVGAVAKSERRTRLTRARRGALQVPAATSLVGIVF